MKLSQMHTQIILKLILGTTLFLLLSACGLCAVKFPELRTIIACMSVRNLFQKFRGLT